MEISRIDQVRRFNRTVTQRVGALDASYLNRGRPLSEARLLCEIGLAGGADVRALRRKLGLDSGYLSRLLRALERQGLVEVAKSDGDGRVRQARLTAEGRAEHATYDELSDRLAESMLAPLDEAERGRLVAAMAEVERLIRGASVTVALEPADSVDAEWCLREYFSELSCRFENGFDVTLGHPGGAAEMTPPAGWFVIARIDGEPVGCGALKRLDAHIGEIKRVWTAPAARGLGVARKMLARLEAVAREEGLATLCLDTNKALTEAHALYRKAGYHEIGRYNDNPYAHHWFEKALS